MSYKIIAKLSLETLCNDLTFFLSITGRSSLMINSNYYTLDAIKKSPTPIQAARAGNLVHMAFQFRRQSAKQELTPIIVQGI